MEWLKAPFPFPVKHFDAEHMTEKGGHKSCYKNRNNNYEPMATDMADVEEIRENVSPLTFQRC